MRHWRKWNGSPRKGNCSSVQSHQSRSFAHRLTHSLAHSLTHSLTQSLTLTHQAFLCGRALQPPSHASERTRCPNHRGRESAAYPSWPPVSMRPPTAPSGGEGGKSRALSLYRRVSPVVTHHPFLPLSQRLMYSKPHARKVDIEVHIQTVPLIIRLTRQHSNLAAAVNDGDNSRHHAIRVSTMVDEPTMHVYRKPIHALSPRASALPCLPESNRFLLTSIRD